MTKYDVLLFDLFFTLVEPQYLPGENEFDALGISMEKWETHAEHNSLYYKRITGGVHNKFEIIEDILSSLGIPREKSLVKNLANQRLKRISESLIHVSPEVINTLHELKKNNKTLILVSNADVLDIEGWIKSPLCQLFDEVFFSCNVGYAKPDLRFYNYILHKLELDNKRCLFVGDGGDDELLGAFQLNIDTAQATYFYDRELFSHSNKVTYKINKIEELLAIVR
ncbi:HAD family hydrolase [Vagococcus sp. BWB3-3]|uniref:HAD family hydrolase n=1 Tax=Vagococcus allomyrinae TaxID=2794353 RepID=A0A940PAW3_9ENTE|nr:HAD family hydrolase [Vagococcus allomyrinae]MBP1041634.1 HAD family hydrolase [Vagococcus allomyrinae]